jgi:hypothetical protein
MKYPLPATAVVPVEPSAVITDCQDIAFKSIEPPSESDDPFTVILELASLALDTEPSSKSAVATEQSTSAFEPIFDIAIVLNLFLYIYNTSLLKFVSYNYYS